MAGQIFYDIEQSTYFLKRGKWCFFFSSLVNREKFLTRVSKFIYDFNALNFSRWHVIIDLSDIAMLVLYSKIEHRGHYVLYGGERVWQNKVKFDGEIKIEKESLMPLGHSTPNGQN